MAIHIIPIALLGAAKVGLMIAKSDVVVETSRHFTEKAHAFYPNRFTRKLLDILDHDDTKYTGFILNEGISFSDVKSKIENCGEMAIPMNNGKTATGITDKNDKMVDVDFVVVAREDVMDRVINKLLGDCKQYINFTPKQPVTALGQLVRSASGMLPEGVKRMLPKSMIRTQ